MPFRATKSSKVDALKHVALFSACTTKELNQIASLVDELEVPEGAELTKEGAPGREFFAIVDGEAKVKRGKKTLATLGEGSFFGEMSLLDQGPRTATVVADGPMKLYVLDARRFSTLLDQHPAVARKILRVLAQRLRGAEKAPTH